MKKHLFANIFLIMIFSIFLSGCSLLEGLFLTTDEVPQYSFSGYVYADGEPLANATINCGQITTSNEFGYYSFEGVKNAVGVSVSKDGYLFDSKPKVVSEASTSVNFDGYRIFDKRGVVKNGDEFVSGVEILVESASGTYPTISNANGEFYMPNLAGHVKLTASKDKFTFFTQSFSISKEDDVVVQGKADISGEIIVDSKCGADDFTLTCDGRKVEINDDLTFDVSNVSFGVVLELSSSSYHVVSPKVTVKSVDDIGFACYRYYDIVGQVKCGNVDLDGVNISTGRATVTSDNGHFEIQNYYGEATVSCLLDGYTFESVSVSYTNSSIIINATTNIELNVRLDVGSDYKGISVKVGEQVFDKCTRDGKFVLTNVQFGQTIEVLSSDYHVPNAVTIVDRMALSMDLQKLYSVNIIAKCGDTGLGDVVANVGSSTQVVGVDGLTIDNLYGSNRISFSKDGYVFLDSFEVNYYLVDVVAEAFRIYDIVGMVHSGETIVQGASITGGEHACYSIDTGEFTIANAYGDIELVVSKEGFKSQTIIASIDNSELDINLEYDVTGTIKCGTLAVADVKVEAGNTTAYSDSNGNFALCGIFGENIIKFSKDGYTFEDMNVSNCANLEVNTNYEIAGNVNTSDGIVSGLEVLIASKSTGEVLKTTTDGDGNYSFNGLVGAYILYYGQTDITLRPKQYDVRGGGDYNFSNTGFSFGGTVKCGESVLSGVTLTIGGVSVTTDENGVYSFPLVSVGGAITLNKEGYTFEGSGMNIDDTFDSRTDVDFDATYKVVINVKSGKIGLDGVAVCINGESKGFTTSGVIEVSGLIGTNTIALSLDNYKFVGTTSVSGYMVLDYSACFDVAVTISSKDILVAGVSYLVNGTRCDGVTNSDGEMTIPNIKLGDLISFEKEGYSIDNKSIISYVESVDVSASYTVSGNVSNCGTPIEGVEVSIAGGGTTLTNKYGDFSFANVVGSVTLSFSKNGFDFDDILVNNPNRIDVVSMYAISGVVKLSSGTGIGGVEVFVDGVKRTTTSLTGSVGFFTIEGLNKAVRVTFAKVGYTFDTELDVYEPMSNVDVYGTYEISGYVKSGSVAINNAKVFIGSTISVRTDANGYYTIKGLDREVEVDVEADDYDDNSAYKMVSGYSKSVNFELTYTVTLSIKGDSSAIKVLITGESARALTTYNSSTIDLTGLKGLNTITISKDSYIVTPNKVDTNSGLGLEIDTKLVYNITGTVKTSEGIVVPNAVVLLGSSEYCANANGVYSITGLTGSNSLSARLPFKGSNNNDISKSYGQVNKSGTYDIVFTAKAFYLGLLNHSYYNLNNGNGYQIVGTGSVNAVADIMSIKSDSTVDVHYKQDANGIKIFENKNNGGVAAGVDPNVSLLTLYNTKTGEVRNQFISGKDNVLDTSVNYKNTWDSWNNGSQVGTVDAYKTKFGVDITGFSPYIINLDTINSATNISDSGNDYIFKLDLNTTTSVTNYNILMGIMCDKKDMKGFNSIILTITISKTGYIKEMKMAEKYTVETNKNASISGASAEVTGNITYTFYTNQNNKTGDIDATSPITAVQNIRTLETYDDVYTLNSLNKTTQKVDLIVCKKEEIL